MRRIFVLALAALALLGVVTPDASAQAPTPTFKINGLIDQMVTYSRNASNYDGDLARNDKQVYGRTRGRLDFIGEVGKAKGVVGIEMDLTYGQVGSNDANIVSSGAAATTAVQVCSGCTAGFDMNTDVRTAIELKWLYTEFELPLIPVPTVVRIGAQPFGGAASYKLAAYATGDYAGLNLVTTITPNVKINFTYAQLEEALVGREGGSGANKQPTTGGFGIPGSQLRGDDLAIIMSPEITPIKGLDLKPMYSYFYGSGTVNAASRQGRGGVNTSSAYTNADGSWKGGINEDRHTVGLDARLRLGPFSLDPTIMYQFGHRDVVVPGVAGGVCTATNSQNCLALASGKAPGTIARADISAWLFDIRAGFQIGPLLIEGLYMFTTGNKARDTTLNNVYYFQPLGTDTGYLADWGTQLSSLGLDYFSALNEGAVASGMTGVTIGWDKYGRHQAGIKASYFLTPNLSASAGVSVHLTHRAIDTNASTQNCQNPAVCSVVGVAGGGLLPAYAIGKQDGDTNYMGTEFHGVVSWRFAPGLSWDNGMGYMVVGQGFKAYTGATGLGKDVKDAFIGTSRVRLTF